MSVVFGLLVFLVLPIMLFMWETGRVWSNQPAPKVLDGDQARIRSLEHELGLCEDAIYVPGEHWLVCSALLPVDDPRPIGWGVRSENAERAIRRTFGVPRPIVSKKHGVTNDFGPRNERLWKEEHD